MFEGSKKDSITVKLGCSSVILKESVVKALKGQIKGTQIFGIDDALYEITSGSMQMKMLSALTSVVEGEGVYLVDREATEQWLMENGLMV